MVRDYCLSARGIDVQSFLMTTGLQIPPSYEKRSDGKKVPFVALLKIGEEVDLFTVPVEPCKTKGLL
eukprot:2833685-Amphidinium_carterae.1